MLRRKRGHKRKYTEVSEIAPPGRRWEDNVDLADIS